ncbi:uncharacterized protein [Dermacentor andersoni]|uniref:uncharacterized protein n=1 Tax=Dermacentor andersoni TaxID=34620 RepID=UPI003B3B6EE1
MDRAGSFALPAGDDTQDHARSGGTAVATFQHINLPPFWPYRPSTWLLQVDAHFRLRHTASQQSKFLHLVSSLPPDVSYDLADVISSPNPSHPFDTLTASTISRKSQSERTRLQQILTAAELGNSYPLQLLRRIGQLLGGVAVFQEDRLLRELFYQRLPPNMVPVLVVEGDVSLENLAQLADRSNWHSLKDMPPILHF